MASELAREVGRNMRGINRFYSDVCHDSDYDPFGPVILFCAAPVVYTVGLVEPFIETPIRKLAKCIR